AAVVVLHHGGVEAGGAGAGVHAGERGLPRRHVARGGSLVVGSLVGAVAVQVQRHAVVGGVAGGRAQADEVRRAGAVEHVVDPDDVARAHAVGQGGGQRDVAVCPLHRVGAAEAGEAMHVGEVGLGGPVPGVVVLQHVVVVGRAERPHGDPGVEVPAVPQAHVVIDAAAVGALPDPYGVPEVASRPAETAVGVELE